ncbi:hypothetical protein MG293_014376 [Ovis ammon polii]|uniref:TCTP domain-containing protein n=1 Tax=Ovis ammon polii TaxID=230172 RepID=A0AAD4Y2E6_OVIAM|nr:hypothetical protein MG293_014376 [Ovis ammon polii]
MTADAETRTRVAERRRLKCTIIIIYEDLISHDEMFSAICHILEVADPLSWTDRVWRWKGIWPVGQSATLMTRSLAEISLLKTPKDEGTESTAIADIDIVMNHHLQEIRFTKEAYK